MKIENSSVLTLRDLATWSFDGTALAVLGHPIDHSISPPMHNAALGVMAHADPRFGQWKYFRFNVPPADLSSALSLFHEKRFRGLNLTIPHKILAVPQVAAIDPAAKMVGAVNTLLWTEHGWHGHNTDGYGLATGLREDLGQELKGANVILVGAGGAARGAAVECLRQRCASLWISNRTAENLRILLDELSPLAGSVPVYGFAPDSPPRNLPAGAVLVNATSVGLRSSDPLPISLAALPAVTGVYDMIYNPPETALLRQARSLGVRSANGLSMLVHQGARALSLWTGRDVPVDAMRAAAIDALHA